MDKEWRCQKCETLLGIWRNGKLHLQYKKVQYLVDGTVVAVCRNCSTVNEAHSGKPVESSLQGLTQSHTRGP